MSNSEDEETKIEIQKLLVAIDSDMIKLKDELSSLEGLIDENASLPTTVRLTNEKLMIAANEAGIDMETLEDVLGDSDEETRKKESSGKNKKSNKSKTTKSNAEVVAAAVDELAKKVKRTLKK